MKNRKIFIFISILATLSSIVCMKRNKRTEDEISDFKEFINKIKNKHNLVSLLDLSDQFSYSNQMIEGYKDEDESIWGKENLRKAKNTYINSFVMFLFKLIEKKIKSIDDEFNIIMKNLDLIKEGILKDYSVNRIFENNDLSKTNFFLLRTIYLSLKKIYSKEHENKDEYKIDSMIEDARNIKKLFLNSITDIIDKFKDKLNVFDKTLYGEESFYSNFLNPILVDVYKHNSNSHDNMKEYLKKEKEIENHANEYINRLFKHEQANLLLKKNESTCSFIEKVKNTFCNFRIFFKFLTITFLVSTAFFDEESEEISEIMANTISVLIG